MKSARGNALLGTADLTSQLDEHGESGKGEIGRNGRGKDGPETVRYERSHERHIHLHEGGDTECDQSTHEQNRYLNLLEELRQTMARNPYLRVFITNGYYDMATPFAATEWTFDHLGYEPSYRERVSMGYYEAGHMMYIHPDMLRRFKEDVASFIESSRSSMEAPTSQP